MANKYFIAGVGRALLFDGNDLFADCRTLADSSITIGVTAEDIRGGEGNKLWGQYFHDSSFSLKLTDIMFDLEYLAKEVGSTVDNQGEVFKQEELAVKASGADKILELSEYAVPLAGSTAYAWIRPVDAAGKSMKKYEVSESNLKEVKVESTVAEGTKYCVMYKYNSDAARQISVNAQFIPSTVHAVLTVALYLGDACDVEAATKAGEVTIDIPRLQLSGAMDLTMSATGAAQMPLEGNALAFGCSGCNNDGIYATITKVIFNANWYDDIESIVLDDPIRTRAAGAINEQFDVYAYYENGSLLQIPASKCTWEIEAGTTGLTINNGVVSGTGAAGTANIKAKITAGGVTLFETTGTITIA